MSRKQKKFPGELDSNVFARVASREVREAREDNQGELGQRIALTVSALERDTILAALRLWQCDSAHVADVDGSIADIAEEHGDALTAEDIDGLCARINTGDSLPQKATAEPKAIHIYMEGGIIQDIEYPAGVKILTYDYDLEGADADRIEKDGKGDDCIITRYDIK